MSALCCILLHVGNYSGLSNVLEVQVIFLYGLETVESQIVVGMGECTLTLLTKQHRCYRMSELKLNSFFDIFSYFVICFVASFLLLIIRLSCMNIRHQSRQQIPFFEALKLNLINGDWIISHYLHDFGYEASLLYLWLLKLFYAL